MSKPRVGLIGVGMMGKPMARRLMAAGYPLTVHDVRREPVEELAREGAGKTGTPRDVAEKSDVVLTSLPALHACEEVYLGANGLMAAARAGQTFVETSTVPPSTVRQFAAEGAKRGVTVMDAALLARNFFHPGLGNLKANEIVDRGMVTVLVGGNAEDLEKVRPVLAAFGDPILHLGPVGSGEIVKVLCNAMSHAAYCVLCEILAVASKADVDIAKLHEIMTHTGSKSSLIENVLPHYLKTGTGKMMSLEAAMKDSEAMLQLGREFGVPMPMQGINQSYYQWAAGRGFKDRPWDELLKLWEEFIGKPIRFPAGGPGAANEAGV